METVGHRSRLDRHLGHNSSGPRPKMRGNCKGHPEEKKKEGFAIGLDFPRLPICRSAASSIGAIVPGRDVLGTPRRRHGQADRDYGIARRRARTRSTVCCRSMPDDQLSTPEGRMRQERIASPCWSLPQWPVNSAVRNWERATFSNIAQERIAPGRAGLSRSRQILRRPARAVPDVDDRKRRQCSGRTEPTASHRSTPRASRRQGTARIEPSGPAQSRRRGAGSSLGPHGRRLVLSPWVKAAAQALIRQHAPA